MWEGGSVAAAKCRDLTEEEKEGLRRIGVETRVAAQARAFREALRPFRLDQFVLSDAPQRFLGMPDGRVLAEFRSMSLPVWDPEKLRQLEAAGFEIVTFLKKYSKHAPCPMYYVRSVREIWRENHGNQ